MEWACPRQSETDWRRPCRRLRSARGGAGSPLRVWGEKRCASLWKALEPGTILHAKRGNVNDYSRPDRKEMMKRWLSIRVIRRYVQRDIRMPRRNCRPVSWVMEEVVR